MNIVVIDSGLSPLYPRDRIIGGITVCETEEEGKYRFEEEFSDKFGHGTGVTDVILKNSKDANLYIINIYKDKEIVSEDMLYAAMEYAMEHLDFEIMHISSGVNFYSRKLHELVKRITSCEGKIIISAFDNAGAISYPSAFPEVIGIDHSMEYSNKDQYSIVEDNIIDVIGAKTYFRIFDLNGKTMINQGTSFLAAYFTSKICGFPKPLAKKTVMEKLKENAVYVFPKSEEKEISGREMVQSIKKAVVFPFNKEIHSLAAFEDLMPFEVEGYYDIRHKFLVGRKICEILPHIDNEKMIQNIDTLDWDADFDAMICGHVGEISTILKKDYLEEILSLAKEHNKKVFFFDNLYDRYEDFENDEQFFCPYGDVSIRERNLFGKMNTPNIPLLAVLGTSSKQGKFTVQLSIMRELKKRGIQCDGLSSEPSGVLLGYSETIPFGYGSHGFMRGKDLSIHANALIRNIELTQPEIIITGCQSGTLSRDLCHVQYMLHDQYSFLLGVNPDGIILCVNNYDDEDYLKRTRAFIESVCEGKIMAVVLSNVTKIFSQSIWDNPLRDRDPLSKEDVERLFGLPVFTVPDLDISGLVDKVVEYYS